MTDIPDDKFDAVATLRFALRQRWIVGACLLGGVATGMTAFALRTPNYVATARLEVSQEAPKALGSLSDTSQASGTRRIETARQYISARPSAKAVVDRLGLAERRGFFDDGRVFVSEQARYDAAVGKVKAGLTSTLVRNTGILRVAFEHTSPEIARDVANAAVDAYLEDVLAASRATAEKAKAFLDDRTAEAKAKLEASTAEMVNYAKANNITTLGDATSLLMQSIGEMNRLLAVNVLERMTAERDVEQMAIGGAQTLPQAFASETTEAAKRRIIDLEGKYQEQRQFMKPSFPEMLRLRAQIDGLQRSLDEETALIGRSVRLKAEHARRKETVIRAEIDKLEKESRDYENRSIRYGILKRETEFDRTHYQGIVERQRAAGVDVATADPGAQLIEAARRPTTAEGAGLLAHLLGGLGIFSVLGGGVILVRETLDETHESAEGLAAATGLRLLGSAPFLRERALQVAQRNAGSPLRRSHRLLRSTLAPVLDSGTVRHVLVCGAEGGEGASLTAMRLAADAARPDMRVLLVDADLRRPSLGVRHGETMGPGLSDLLRNPQMGSRVAQCFHATDKENLTFLPAGAAMPDADDWLSGPRMANILETLSRGYDLIVIDGPAVQGNGEAPLLAAVADATVLVTAAQRSHASAVIDAAQRLNAAGGTILGTFVTRVRPDPLARLAGSQAAPQALPAPEAARREDPVGRHFEHLSKNVKDWWQSAA